MASATEEPGGMTAVNLQVAQRYVDAFAKIAEQSNTLVVPANMGDLASLITSSMAIVKGELLRRLACPMAMYVRQQSVLLIEV